MPSSLYAVLLLTLLSMASAAEAGSPIEVQVELPQTVIPIGEPLAIHLRVRNIGNQIITPFISVGVFHRTHYFELDDIGCDIQVFGVTPAPGHPHPPPQFGFTWLINDLAPSDNVTCLVRFPYTLYPGTDTISVRSSISGVSQLVTSFTYTLTPRGVPAQPVPSGNPVLWLVLAALLGTFARQRLLRTRLTARQ